jgi:hypothetical protein
LASSPFDPNLRSVAINQASIASLNHPITNQVTGEVITANTQVLVG